MHIKHFVANLRHQSFRNTAPGFSTRILATPNSSSTTDEMMMGFLMASPVPADEQK